VFIELKTKVEIEVIIKDENYRIFFSLGRDYNESVKEYFPQFSQVTKNFSTGLM
jgi:hypothetical protein